MATTRPIKFISQILFFVGLTLTTVCFLDTWRQPFFINTHYKALKLSLCVLIPAVVTLFNYLVEKSFSFIAKCSVAVSSLFVIGYIIDQLTIKWISCFGSFVVIFHLAYGLISMATVLLCCVIIKLFTKNKQNDFNSFYNIFFNGFAIILGFIFVLIYFVLRQYGTVDAQINLVPFNGEIKNVVLGKSIYTMVRTFGNIFFYSAITLTVMRFFKSRQCLFGVVIPLGAAVLCEIFEVLTKCGEADIDDLIMNTAGVLLGIAIQKLVINRLLLNKE